MEKQKKIYREPYHQERDLSKDENRKTIAVNLFIIREIFNLIKDKRISNSDFYSYIFDMDKSSSEMTMTSIVNTGYGNVEKFAKKLIEYGLSEEYFSKNNPEYIQAPDEVVNLYAEYLDLENKLIEDPYGKEKKTGKFDINKLSPEERKKEEQRDKIRDDNRDHKKYMKTTLLENIFLIKNKDDSLVIDCLRNVILDYLEINTKTVPKLYDISAHIVDTTPTAYLSQKQIQQYYANTVSDFIKYNIADLSGKISARKIYGKKNNGFTFYLIRESYQILSQIDADRPDALDKFYNYLELSEKDYKLMIDTNVAPNKKMADLLIPFKYPASLFRGDVATKYDISDDIKNYYIDYYCNGDYDLFNNALTVYLCYKISSDNIGLVMPTLALINYLYPEN